MFHPCLVLTFASGEELLFETAGSYPFDLILLDIDLGCGKLSGLELARQIRETDARVALAFLTNYPNHVSLSQSRTVEPAPRQLRPTQR